jgi:hypothetical protein
MKINLLVSKRWNDKYQEFKNIAELPAKTHYGISKITKKLIEESKHYEETRGTLVDKYCEKEQDDKGMRKFLNDEAKESFIKELTALESTEFEIYKLSIKEILDATNKVKSEYFEVLEDIFNDDVT